MINKIIDENKSSMDNAIEALKRQLNTIRAGRASPTMLQGIRVEYYGTPTALDQVANISVSDARTIVVKAWEKNVLKDIETAILKANIGLHPQNDGELIRLPIPPLSEERRKEYVKQAKSKSENTKVAIRNARRDANEKVKSAKKDGDISEDDEKKGLKSIQDVTDKYIKTVDEVLANKEAEIMKV